MIDLADAGQRLASWDAGEPTDPTALRRRAERRTRRRRISGGAVALVAVTALVLGGVLPFRPSSSQARSRVAGPFPAVPFPVVPRGWRWILAGPVALASPYSGLGILPGLPGPSLMLCGPPPPGSPVGCGGAVDSTLPTRRPPVLVNQLRGKPSGVVHSIHGLRVYVSGGGQQTDFAVPALGVDLETYGALGRRIAATLVPSPLMVLASTASAPAVPGRWRSVHYSDLTVSVPPSWPVVHLSQPPFPSGSRGYCEAFPRAELVLGNPPGSCGHMLVTGSNGLWLGRSIETVLPLTTTRLRWVHGARVELLWSRENFGGTAELAIQTPRGVVRGTISLLTDSTTVEQVLASIRVTG